DVMKSGLLYNLKFLGLFNVKYLVARQEFRDPQIEKVYHGSKIVFYNKLFMPRSFFIRNYRVIQESNQVLEYLKSPGFDPRKEVVLEESPDVHPDAADTGRTNRLQIVSREPDKIVIKAQVNNSSFLFLSEVFYPKWECLVDGRKSKIYKTDYLFRSVYLNRGDHEIVFRYGNNGLYLIITLVSLIATLGLLFLIIRHRKKYFLY
ncbi:MAG: YfhO family protein, partial [bacterium]|nr:YfhO family protein [bacterium]